MSISPVSSSIPPAVQANQAAKAAPAKRDRDGDFDNNAVETKTSEAVEGKQLLNVKA